MQAQHQQGVSPLQESPVPATLQQQVVATTVPSCSLCLSTCRTGATPPTLFPQASLWLGTLVRCPLSPRVALSPHT